MRNICHEQVDEWLSDMEASEYVTCAIEGVDEQFITTGGDLMCEYLEYQELVDCGDIEWRVAILAHCNSAVQL